MPDGKTYNLPCIDRRVHISAAECRKLIPHLPGLYFYLSDDNVVRYVGVASNLALRCVNYHTFSPRYSSERRDWIKTLCTAKYWNQKIAFMPFSLKYRIVATRAEKGQQRNYFVAAPELYYLEFVCLSWFKPVLNATDRSTKKAKVRWAIRLPALTRSFRHLA